MHETAAMETMPIDLTRAANDFAKDRAGPLVAQAVKALNLAGDDQAAKILSDLIIVGFVDGARATAIEYAAKLIEHDVADVQLELGTIVYPDLDWVEED